MAASLLRADRAGLRTLTLNRPERRNALDLELLSLLTAALREAGEEEGVEAVLLTGAGPYYSSGNDLGNFLTAVSEGIPPAEMAEVGKDLLHALVSRGRQRPIRLPDRSRS
jgi:enoyl-CoA hydratase/carnithine racemase